MRSRHIKWIMGILANLLILLSCIWIAEAMPPAQESRPDTLSEPTGDKPVVVENVTELYPQNSPAILQIGSAAAIMNQDFEGVWPASGWTPTDESGNDGGQYLWGKRGCHPHAGSYAGWSVGGGVQGGNLSCSSEYPNNARTWAIYGPFDLSGAVSANLSFYLYGHTSGDEGCPWDFFFVGSSVNDTDFSGSRYCGGWTNGTDGNGYSRSSLDLSSRLGQSQVWVALLFLSNSSVTSIGFTVDDVMLDVTGVTPPTRTPTPTPSNTPTPFTPAARISMPLTMWNPTLTPTLTLTPTKTPTPTPTLTPTKTPTVTRTPTPTPYPTVITSAWADHRPSEDGVLAPEEWSRAGKLSGPWGTLYVQNDNDHIYFAIDWVGNTESADAQVELQFDSPADARLNPGRDPQYNWESGSPTTLARLEFYEETYYSCSWRSNNPNLPNRVAHKFDGHHVLEFHTDRDSMDTAETNHVGITLELDGKGWSNLGDFKWPRGYGGCSPSTWGRLILARR